MRFLLEITSCCEPSSQIIQKRALTHSLPVTLQLPSMHPRPCTYWIYQPNPKSCWCWTAKLHMWNITAISTAPTLLSSILNHNLPSVAEIWWPITAQSPQDHLTVTQCVAVMNISCPPQRIVGTGHCLCQSITEERLQQQHNTTLMLQTEDNPHKVHLTYIPLINQQHKQSPVHVFHFTALLWWDGRTTAASCWIMN